MTTLAISSLSTVYYQVEITPTVNGQPYNPTADQVQLAFMQGITTKPGPSDWNTGSWDTGLAGEYLAQCLIGPGPGAVTLPTGTYTAWVKIVDSPEIPVLPGGTLIIE